MEDVIVGHRPLPGRGMMTTPDAEPDDGLFDGADQGRHEAGGRPGATPDLQGHVAPPPEGRGTAGSRRRGRDAGPLPVQLDGEQPGTAPVRFEIEPAAIRLRVPPARWLWRWSCARPCSPSGYESSSRLGLLELASCSRACDPLLELVEAANLLLDVVHPLRSPLTLPTTSAVVCELATRKGRPRPGRRACSGCPASPLPWRNLTPVGAFRQLLHRTGVPVGASRQSRLTVPLLTRMQPFETGRPSSDGRLVPDRNRSALRPAVQHFIAAEMPIAAQPYGPRGSSRKRWLT